MTELPQFLKYPKIKAFGSPENSEVLNDDIVVEEKLDGANCAVRKYNGELLLSSRNRYLIDNPDKSFNRFIAWVEAKDWSELPEGYVVYMEYMRKHTLEYTDLPDLCVGLDVFVIKENKFLNLDEKHDLLNKLEIIPVPVLFTGKVTSYEELKQYIKKSNYSTIDMEGIVIKNYTTQWDTTYRVDRQCAKIVRDEFKEQMKVAMAKPDVLVEIVESFTTPARMLKGIDRLKEEGKFTGSLKDLAYLPKIIVNDIFEEQEIQIKDMLFKAFNRELSRRIARKVVPFYKDWVGKQGDINV